MVSVNKHPEISWSRWEPMPSASEQMIGEVEQSLGIRYPADFRALAPEIHGARPTPRCFYVDYPRIGRSGGFIGFVHGFDPTRSDFVMKTVEPLTREGILPRGVVPFGEDGGGDLMAFDFREDSVNPPVVYVAIASATDDEDDERHIVPLADSFTEFLAMLRDSDTPDQHSEGR